MWSVTYALWHYIHSKKTKQSWLHLIYFLCLNLFLFLLFCLNLRFDGFTDSFMTIFFWSHICWGGGRQHLWHVSQCWYVGLTQRPHFSQWRYVRPSLLGHVPHVSQWTLDTCLQALHLVQWRYSGSGISSWDSLMSVKTLEHRMLYWV